MPPRRKKTAATPPKEISFDYIKSNYFRVIRADGAWGGLIVPGAIHMALFTERPSIPQKVVYRIEGSELGPEIREKREGRTAWIREVEVGVTLELQQAINLRNWLGDKIQALQGALANKANPASSPKKAKGNGKHK